MAIEDIIDQLVKNAARNQTQQGGFDIAPIISNYLSTRGQQQSSGPVDASGLDPDLAWLIGKESSGRTTAKNPRSSAFGLGQLIKSNRQHYAGQLGIANPDTTDYNEQLRMMQAYIQNRYGTPTAARRFWEAKGWY